MRIVKMVLLVTCLTLLAGCLGNKPSIYVLNQSEVIKMRTGDTVTAEQPGWYFSNEAVKRVMAVKIDDTNLR